MAGSETQRGSTLTRIAAAVAPWVPVEVVGDETKITDVHMDSRAVGPGSLYVAIRGERNDGHRFVSSAVAAGAVAVAVEEPPQQGVPYLLVADTRKALGWMAAETHGYPARSLGVVGITGTNGKTTVAHMLAAMTEGSCRATAVVGTVSANLGDLGGSPRTTPEASKLQRIMRRLVDEGRVTDLAIEVSSHAMVLGRVNGVEFDVVAFTNLSQDHLDYHVTMEEYYRAKAGLFNPQWAPRGVVWTDDPWGRRLAAEASIPVVTVGAQTNADVVVGYRSDTLHGSQFTLDIDGESVEVETTLAGRFNVANAAIAIVCARLQGVDIDSAKAGLRNMAPIPGRYNTLRSETGIWVIVDYAHTPDAITNIIEQSRSLIGGRVIVVVGAGGDRDREKRPMMGEAASTADVVFVTTDNPRSEDPLAIIDQVMAGVTTAARVTIQPDRRLAIRQALSAADVGDAVLLLGKGHETGQEFADKVEPFDDRIVAREELDRLAEVSS
jgi:UDP-N-acetylmuramoyl-L-alanyl-D-glutamate--2,6-diaminopimelate ligase